MELKRIYLKDDARHFEFVEEKETITVRLDRDDRDFGYLALFPQLLLREKAEVIDERMPESDEVLTFIGRERVLVASAVIIQYLANTAEVPLHLVLEERYRQRILTIFSNRFFFNIDSLERQLKNIIDLVDRQIPYIREDDDEEEMAETFDPLDHIGEEGVAIYDGGERPIIEVDSLGGGDS